MNAELRKISNWLLKNKLSINTSKTTYMITTNQKINHCFKIYVQGKELSETKDAKYLGLVIDNKLTWNKHTNNVRNRLASGCWALHKMKRILSQDSLKMVYFGLIYQTLQYCISCWGGAAPCHLKPLDVLNKRAIRTICGAHRNEHTTPLFHKLGILKLNDLYVWQIGKIMHKISNSSWNGTYDFTKVNDVHKYPTRFSQQNNYHRGTMELKMTDRALTIAGPDIWSKIPAEIKSLPFNSFKKSYKKYLIEKYKTS